MDLALFDFDGTITTKEMLPDFVKMAIPRSRFLMGYTMLAPVILGYKLGIVSGSFIRRAIVRVAFSGLAVSQYQEQGRKFAAELASVIRPEMLARIYWHQERGDRIAVVSGAFDVYLSHWCKAHQLDLICSSLQARDGRLTGRYQGKQCVGIEKASRVRSRYELASYSTIYAYGDTPEDEELLKLASRQYYQGKER